MGLQIIFFLYVIIIRRLFVSKKGSIISGLYWLQLLLVKEHSYG